MKVENCFATNQNFDVIIQAGQSNAEGFGRGEAKKPYIPTEKVLYLSSNYNSKIVSLPQGIDYQILTYPNPLTLEIAAEREIEGTVGDFSLSFAREYINAGMLEENRKLLVIRAAIGGTGFAKGFWLTGGIGFLKLLEMISFVKDKKGNNRFVGFLWHQGEHDAWENSEWSQELRSKEYQKNLLTVIEFVRKECEEKSLPVIAAGFCEDWAAKNAQTVNAVTIATRNVLEEVGCSAYVETRGLLSNRQVGASPSDDIHFCRESLYDLGIRCFKEFEKIIKKEQ